MVFLGHQRNYLYFNFYFLIIFLTFSLGFLTFFFLTEEGVRSHATSESDLALDVPAGLDHLRLRVFVFQPPPRRIRRQQARRRSRNTTSKRSIQI